MDAKLWLVFLLCLAAATQPGIQAGLSQTTLDDFKNQVLPQVLSQLSTVELDDYYKQIGSGFLSATVVVNKIRCTGLTMNVATSQLALTAPDSLVLTASGLTGKMTFSWGYESPLGGDSGEGSVQVLPTTIAATFKVSQLNGKPVVTVSSMTFTISDLSISITNTPIASVANWLLSVMKENLIQGLTEVLNQYGAEITQSILSEFLAGYTTQAQLTPTIAIDYQLTADPVITSGYAQVGISGSFIDLTHPGEAMLVQPPVSLPNFDTTSKKVQVYVSVYTLNTGLYAGMTSGAFEGEITPNTPQIGQIMNTNGLLVAFPGLNEVYGDNQPCTFYCKPALPAPAFSATASSIGQPGTLTGEFLISCDLHVNDTIALSVDVGAAFDTQIILTNWVLDLSLLSANVTTVHTYDSTLPDPSNDDELMAFMNTVLSLLAPGAFAKVFGNGLPLPTLPDVDLSDSQLLIEDGYLAILVTPVYHYEPSL